MRASLLGYWHQARSPQRFAYLVGTALILVGLAHLAGWLAVGGAWQGPVSFRKPTTFGISFGLATITLAWVTGQLRISDRGRWLLLGPLAAADTYEVLWVSVQRWRGVASHFNFGTTLDTWLFLLGGAAIAVTVTVILVLTVLAFTAMQAPPSMALAIRAGLVILLVAQAVGGWMIQHGVGPASDGVQPDPPWVRLGRFGGQLSLLGPASGPLPQLEPVTVGVQRRDADAVGIVHGLRFHELHAAGPKFLEVLA